MLGMPNALISKPSVINALLFGGAGPMVGTKNLDLQKLPDEVKTLVNSGIYSMYRIDGHTTASFVLITEDRKFFLVSDDGEILSQVDSISGLKLVEPKKFDNLSRATSNFVSKINFAS